MRKIIIIKNKKTNKLTVKIVSVKKLNIVDGVVFIYTNKQSIILSGYNDKYLVQDVSGNNLTVFFEKYVRNN